MVYFLPKHELPKLARTMLLGLLAVGLLMSSSGCTRRFFRRRADAEVDNIICQKDKYPQWKVENYYVYPHPLSRFADPTDPDRPPMPVDDPAAWDLSPHPQRPLLKGYRYWQGTGYLELMRKWDEEYRAKKDAQEQEERRKQEGEGAGEEEPLLPGELKTFAQRLAEINDQIERELNSPVSATQYTPLTLEVKDKPAVKPFILNMDQITGLGFMNSREFQTIREQLYLTALAVTAERFAFIAQPFVTEQTIRQRLGQDAPGGPSNSWVANTTAGFTKAFSTGALLLFNFANQTVYNLGGGAGGTTSVSTINLDIVQPFLAGGGRAVALEPLTQAERDLVYAIRDFFRLRQEYFVFFAAGQSTGFIPGVGAGVVALNPTTVVQPNAFVPGPFTLPIVNNPATVQVAPQPPLGSLTTPNGGGSVLTTPQGYLSTIMERANLVNFYKNIQALQRFLRLFEVFLDGGLAQQVQKGQVEQQLLASYETVLGQHVSYRVSLDQLKQQLGLPLTIPLELDPSPLQPMITINEAYEKVSIDAERVVYNGLRYGQSVTPQEMRQRLRRLFERTPLLRGTKTRERISQLLPVWEKLGQGQQWLARQDTLLARIRKLEAERDRLGREQGKRPGEPIPEAIQRRLAEINFDLDVGRYEYYLSIYEREGWKTKKTELEQLRDKAQEYARVYRSLLGVTDHAVIEHLNDLKNQWPALPPLRAEGLDLLSAKEDEALAAVERTTFNSRVDLMNVRAQVTDSWRKIRVAANALLGTFNVDYHLGASSPSPLSGNPFSIGGSNTTHQLIFNGQLPLVRILQRNNYRSTLINFQQQRRGLMAYEDQLLFNVRFDLRQMRTLGNNYQTVQKRQMELAYMQVDQALQAFNQPQAPPGADVAGLIGPVAGRPQVGDPAALTTQLLTTQASLLRSQTDLYSTWITYVIDRMNLYRDMGVMPLDNRGVWIDGDATSSNNAADDHQPAPEQQQPAGPPDQLPPPRPERLPQPGADAAAEQDPRLEAAK
jgi:hypothetical protein